MGFLFHNYNQVGPGVNPNEPRKTGLARFFEVVGRDSFSFFKAGFLVLLSCIPLGLGLSVAVVSHAWLPAVLSGLFGGALMGPQLSGLADTIIRSLRDEPGFWWHTYRRSWKRNLRSSLLPGALCGVVFSFQIFFLFHLNHFAASPFVLIAFFLSLIFSLGMFNYIWAQLVLVDLPLYGILKNACFLSILHWKRSLLSILIPFVYWGILFLYMPLSLFVLPATSFWVPMVPALLSIYQPLNEVFHVEETLTQLRAQKEGSDKEA